MRKLVLFALPAVLSSQLFQAAPPPSPAVAIAHVSVIDCETPGVLRDMTVVVERGRIASVAPAAAATIPAGSETLDGSGKYLIPGMWDMHFHLGAYERAKATARSLLANGITGVRDMGSPLDDILRLKREIADGTLLGPRLAVSGPLLETTLPPAMASNPMLISAGTIREARSVVDQLHARGVDFIKVHDSVPRDAYLEIARECKRLRVPFAGHVPPAVSAVEASHAGQRSIEHLGGNYEAVLLACSTREAGLGILARRMLQTSIQAAWRGTAPDETAPFRMSFTKPIVETFSSSKADALIKSFQQNETWQTPTLVALENTWNSMRANLSIEEQRIGEKLLQMDRDLVRRMKRAGVGILGGTDLPLNGTTSRLPDELALLVRAGLSPFEALMTVTKSPAEYLGLIESDGTIAPGKKADLVLLEANPLESIENAKRVSMVIVGGKLIAP